MNTDTTEKQPVADGVSQSALIKALGGTYEFENEVLEWSLSAYGCIVRGDETTSEDQVGSAITPEVARRIAACWNACAGISVDDIELGRIKVIKM